MSAPNYDWLAQLTLMQKKFLEDNYKDLWYTYKTYGYSVAVYDYARDIDNIYDRVKSVNLVEKVDLPDNFMEKIETFYKKQAEICQLKEIVIPVPNYHIALVADDLRLDSELRSVIKEVPVFMFKQLTEDALKSGCVAVVFDDVDCTVTTSQLETCEMLSVPYIRRTVVGWTEPMLNKDSSNLLLNFVERYKPCKRIR